MRSISTIRFGLLLLATSTAFAASIEFNRDVRSILSDKCHVSHGPAAASKHVPFRLDSAKPPPEPTRDR